MVIGILGVAAFSIMTEDAYSITDTDNRDDGDLCRPQKAYWADKENGEDLISGVGDC